MPIIRRTRLFNTACGVCLDVLAVVVVIKQSCSPDDGHDDARNMLRVN
jgi:hypothetical protein